MYNVHTPYWYKFKYLPEQLDQPSIFGSIHRTLSSMQTFAWFWKQVKPWTVLEPCVGWFLLVIFPWSSQVLLLSEMRLWSYRFIVIYQLKN